MRTGTPRSSGRVRPTLLVLLWVWALCVFLVVDLFWNVPEFDAIRPRAPLYRGMRATAHELVGERYVDDASVALAHDGWRRGGPVAAAGELVEHDRHRLDEKHWAEIDAALPAGAVASDSLRAAAEESLAAALRPAAPYRGGVPAMRVAARLGNERTWDLFLALLEARDTVVAKLPLTERRDDLDFLDVTLSAVASRGTRAQRARLARWTAGQLETEPDPEACAHLARCLATLQGE